jgi:hypothetical protein
MLVAADPRTRKGSANAKMAAAVHYIVANMPTERLGSTKLNKILWEADILHFRATGASVTGETAYKKLQHGPVPKGVLDAIGLLVHEGKIVCREFGPRGSVRREFRKIIDPDVSLFKAAEVQALEKAIARLYYLTAREASNRTHDSLWQQTPMNCDIKVSAASVETASASPRTMRWAEKVVDEICTADAFCKAV